MEGLTKVIYYNKGAWERFPLEVEIMIGGCRIEVGKTPMSLENIFRDIITKGLDKNPGFELLEVERAIALDNPGHIALWFTFVRKDKFLM
jgi:hypothetical protein